MSSGTLPFSNSAIWPHRTHWAPTVAPPSLTATRNLCFAITQSSHGSRKVCQAVDFQTAPLPAIAGSNSLCDNLVTVSVDRKAHMKIGILGAGNIGAAAARLFVAAGHE